MRNPIICAIAGLSLFGATACQTGGLGRVPLSLVHLYDQVTPDGVIEIEINRDGTIREMEADIEVSALPIAVRRAVERWAPGAAFTGAEREIQASGPAWEVKLRHQGRNWELVIDEEGNIRETEKELKPSEAPTAVMDAAEREIPGGSVESVEILTRGDKSEYHVKKRRDGAKYKIVLTPDGRVVRKVREAQAEIEIPIRE